jgi:hypothetical protein
MNLYSFGENRPVVTTDASGLQACPPEWQWVPTFPQHHASLDKDKGVQNTSGNAPVARPVVERCEVRGATRNISNPYLRTRSLHCDECGNLHLVSETCTDFEICDLAPVPALSGVTHQLQWLKRTRCR